MRYYGGKVSPLGHLYRCQRLGQGANLIELNQDRVGRTLLDTALKTGRVGHKQVITHKLYTITQALTQQLPAVPVVFRQAIFEGDDGIFRDPLFVEVYHLTGSEGTSLSRQYILAIVVELASCRVHAQENIYTGLVTCCFDGCNDDFQGFAIGAE